MAQQIGISRVPLYIPWPPVSNWFSSRKACHYRVSSAKNWTHRKYPRSGCDVSLGRLLRHRELRRAGKEPRPADLTGAARTKRAVWTWISNWKQMVSRSIVAFSWTHTVGILFVSWLYYKFFWMKSLASHQISKILLRIFRWFICDSLQYSNLTILTGVFLLLSDLLWKVCTLTVWW